MKKKPVLENKSADCRKIKAENPQVYFLDLLGSSLSARWPDMSYVLFTP
jgi:hypothetical protein